MKDSTPPETSYRRIDSDFLIIGSGLAGLCAAHYASRFGSVVLVTKSTLIESNSYWAQGGIAAAVDPADSPVIHAEDTVKAGRGLCNRRAVDVLVNEGRARIRYLIKLGLEFDYGKDGLALGLEGGHSKRRVLHAGSSTGKKMIDFFIGNIDKKTNITVLENTTITDILSDGDVCYGAWGYNQKKEENLLLRAGSTILSTGGASALYKRTTNPRGATGEGISLAYRAGAEIMDMEFIQFHPTAFYNQQGESFLISEAVRGEGAYLVDHKNNRFMKSYHELAELAPRDVVSKSVFYEINRSGREFVYLSLRHLESSFVKQRFPSIYELCREKGYDLTRDLIPVAPAAHYTIGGVKTGIQGDTNIAGLYCCGEAACTGVHGANRLASNSLLECVVFSKRAVEGAQQSSGLVTQGEIPEFRPILLSETLRKDEKIYTDVEKQILELTNGYLGIVRNGEGMDRFKNSLEDIENKCRELSGWFAFKTGTMIDVCSLIVRAAEMRKESRGAHIRDDFPAEDDRYRHHFVFRIGKDPLETDI